MMAWYRVVVGCRNTDDGTRVVARGRLIFRDPPTHTTTNSDRDIIVCYRRESREISNRDNQHGRSN